MKKVFVSGCFDMLHSGHIRFLQEAASWGEVYVSVGSDKTIEKLKNRKTVFNEDERKYMLEALKYVKKVYIGPGEGMLDFEPLLDVVKPDIFFVNQDGDSQAKRDLMAQKGILYIVSERKPYEGLPGRSTTSLREKPEK